MTSPGRSVIASLIVVIKLATLNTISSVEATLASKVVVMNSGRVQQIGTPQEIYERPINLFVAGFIGSPPMNLFPVTLERQGFDVIMHTGRGAADTPFNLGQRRWTSI